MFQAIKHCYLMGNACLEVLKPGGPDTTSVLDISRQGSYSKTHENKAPAALEVPELILVKGISKASIQTPNSSDDDQNSKKLKPGLKLNTAMDYPVSAAEGLDSPTHLNKLPSLQHMIPGGVSSVSLVPSALVQQPNFVNSHQQFADYGQNASTNDGTGFHFGPQSAIQMSGPAQGKIMNKWYMNAASSDLQLLSAIREEQSAMEDSNANFATLGPSRFASSRNNLP